MKMIKKNAQIQLILNNRKSYGNYNFAIFIKKKLTTEGEYAILVGKKLGNAVKRNYLKRKFRHLTRLHAQDVINNYDFVILPKKSSIESDFNRLENQFKKVVSEIKEENV
jgi:ribonuclease P protein component